MASPRTLALDFRTFRRRPTCGVSETVEDTTQVGLDTNGTLIAYERIDIPNLTFSLSDRSTELGRRTDIWENVELA